MKRRVLTLVTLPFVLAGLAGCGKSSTSVTGADAADSIARELNLPDDVKPCLVTALDASSAARHALDGDVTPSDSDLEALGNVVTGCVPATTFAATVSVQMANGYRSVADIPPEKEACLRDQMTQLSAADRALFITGPISRMRDPTSDRSLAVNGVLQRLIAACDIEITGPTTTGTTG
jgi:hypothetical protein